MAIIRIGSRIRNLVLFLMLVQSGFLVAGLCATVASPSSPRVTTDNFSGDSGLWTYKGVAARGNGQVILLNNQTWTSSQLWFNRDIGSPFTVEFDATGVGWGDAAIMMFYKNRDYTPDGDDAFEPSTGYAQGYGIEFDYYAYSGDPGSWGNCHVGLIEDYTSNILSYNMTTISAFPLSQGWAHVVVTVSKTHVAVSINGILWLSYGYAFNMDYNGFGFCGGTNWETMFFKIANVTITEYGDAPAPAAFQPQYILYGLLVAGVVVVGIRVVRLIILQRFNQRAKREEKATSASPNNS